MLINQVAYKRSSFEKARPTCLLGLMVLLFFKTIAYSHAEPKTQSQPPVPAALAGAVGQMSQADPAVSNSKTVPLPHLYWHLLVYQNHLDQVADKRAKQGNNAEPLRRTIQNRIGFADAEFAPVRESALRLKRTLDDITVRAMAIVKADREQLGEISYSTQNPPPGTAALKALSQEREDAIAAEIVRLNNELGTENAQRLKTFIVEHFASHVTVHQLRGPKAQEPEVHP